MIAGNPPGARTNLPPHRYIEIPRLDPANKGDVAKLQWIYTDKGRLFCQKLTRPANIAKGFNVAGGAGAEWGLGRSTSAFAAEVCACPVSIEYYRVDTAEVL